MNKCLFLPFSQFMPLLNVFETQSASMEFSRRKWQAARIGEEMVARCYKSLLPDHMFASNETRGYNACLNSVSLPHLYGTLTQRNFREKGREESSRVAHNSETRSAGTPTVDPKAHFPSFRPLHTRLFMVAFSTLAYIIQLQLSLHNRR